MRRVIVGAGLFLSLLSGAPAAAQVLEIGDGGAVTVLAGPAVTTAAGVRPLLPQAAPALRAAPVELALNEAAHRHGVDARLVRAVAAQESGFAQSARSPKGALGVMQLMPATARELGVDAGDLRANIEGGAAYLSRMLGRFGDVRLALAAYNAGPGAVLRFGGVPPYAETQAYVRRVLARAAALPVLAPIPAVVADLEPTP